MMKLRAKFANVNAP